MVGLEQSILRTLPRGQPFLASFATITEDGKPWVRDVTAVASEDLSLRLCTSINSRKVAQIRRNPEVHLLCGVTDPANVEAYLQIQGRADVSTSKAEREALWREGLRNYFSGPDDPDYAIVIVKPYRIELYTAASLEPEVWEREERKRGQVTSSIWRPGLPGLKWEGA